MPATHEPCPTCKGFGHRCDDEDPAGHIHEHETGVLCEACGGRGLTPISNDPPESKGGPKASPKPKE